MTVIDDYLASISHPQKEILRRMYKVVRQTVPDATEEMSYAMPSFKYRGKGLVAIIVNKNFLSLYPFSSIDKLGIDVSDYECTSGSIHFSVEKPISDKLLKQMVAARINQIDQHDANVR